MDLWPTKYWLGQPPPVRIELVPVAPRDGVHAASPRRPPWWKRRQRQWWDQNVRGLIETAPRFRLRVTDAGNGDLLFDADDYSLYLILCFGSVEYVHQLPHRFS